MQTASIFWDLVGRRSAYVSSTGLFLQPRKSDVDEVMRRKRRMEYEITERVAG